MLRLIKSLFKPQASPKPPAPNSTKQHDPLDPLSRIEGWKDSPPDPIRLQAKNFPVWEGYSDEVAAMDSASTGSKGVSVADGSPVGASGMLASSFAVPEQLQQWFMSQSFIGYQACAIIAQHWLVDKACSMAGEDAIRNGWELKALGEDEELSKADNDRLRSYDIPMKLKFNLAELDRFKNIFGIRVGLFEVLSKDPLYYEKPFNIDGVTPDSYKGISQVDPYWMMPMLTAESTANPSARHFYDPEYWVISGKKYHRSHLIIARGPQPADVLKPTYIFGGIPLTQRIYERVYAAERTANEAPLLSLSKRTTALHVDIEKAITNQSKFEKRLAFWIKYRDNHGVKVLGKDETIDQFDTALADFDSIIMNQYQLVAAIAKVPATKILGTSPKGFNATGDFEMKSYHEELESIQEHTMSPMAERHYMLLRKSLGIEVEIQVVFNAVDSMTAQERADLEDKRMDTATKATNVGAVSPDEVRQAIRDDKHSMFTRLTDDEANEEAGMTPENLAAFQKAGAEQEKSGAAVTTAQAHTETAGAQVEKVEGPEKDAAGGAVPATPTKPLNLNEVGVNFKFDVNKEVIEVVRQLASSLGRIEESLMPEGENLPRDGARYRTTKPGTTATVSPTVLSGPVVGDFEATKLPKVKLNGMVIAVENPRGTIRQGMDIDGVKWSSKMPHHYGYIKGVKGADGDELDCFLGPNFKADKVYVINQNDPHTGEFDEHKCMMGFDDADAAKAAYEQSYQKDWKGFGDMIECSLQDFKTWISRDGACMSPLSAACIGQTTSAPKEG